MSFQQQMRTIRTAGWIKTVDDLRKDGHRGRTQRGVHLGSSSVGVARTRKSLANSRFQQPVRMNFIRRVRMKKRCADRVIAVTAKRIESLDMREELPPIRS
jgi:hypothetical protein